MASFGEHLKELRHSKKLTQKQMAELFNLTERSYQRYESNSSKPHFATLVAIADYFNVSLDYLAGRSDKP